eukprot:GHVS01095649.1.p1 GENE.GHVS01095649.1~~GHVS01095649.1.p1  ORF type:complete len:729 (-),score=89.07 GHVS01095649.1:300-2486(-)
MPVPGHAVLGQSDSLYLGQELLGSELGADVGLTMKEIQEKHIDFVAFPLANPDPPCEWAHDHTACNSRHEIIDVYPECSSHVSSNCCSASYSLQPVTMSDLVLESRVWGSQVIGVVSGWLEPDNQSCAWRRQYSIEALEQQLHWACHLGVYSLIAPTPLTTGASANYARVLKKFMQSASSANVWVRIPLALNVASKNGGTSHEKKREGFEDEDSPGGVTVDGWEIWNRLRMMCDYPSRMGVALEMTDMTGLPGDLERWQAEPVKAIIIPSHLFLSNSKGYPVLPKRHKTFLQQLFKYKVHVIIRLGNSTDTRATYDTNIAAPPTSSSVDAAAGSGPCSIPADPPAPPSAVAVVESIEGYRNFVARLYQQRAPPTEAEQYEYGYLDYLQSPLQPLQDNLESLTYETFEKDPVKYAQYEEAIRRCLADRHRQQSDIATATSSGPVIVVMGAGRGPLVHASLNALESEGIENYRVLAVEKNTNAVFTLKHRIASDPKMSWRRVEVIGSDMRTANISIEADIMVSELLGSFGDNELSPECLDGAQKYLKPGGVSIPQWYVSSLEPVSCNKLWTDIRSYNEQKYMETAYVVRFNCVYFFSAEREKNCFFFQHPNSDAAGDCAAPSLHNRRYAELSFSAKSDALMHGFAGYFHCCLYKDVHISIAPATFSEGMFSWFPLYFPLKEPVYVRRGDVVKCHIWRQDDAHKVWYEWCVSEPVSTYVQNCCGKSYFIGK